jgi:hypothetical protein
MVVIEKLAAEFQVKLAAESGDSFLDLLGLHFEIFIVIKTYFGHWTLSFPIVVCIHKNIIPKKSNEINGDLRNLLDFNTFFSHLGY